MGRAIIQLDEWYLIWSTVVDAPVSWGMTRDQLTEWVREEYGADGVRELPARMKRVELWGTSWIQGATVADTIDFNRAGKDETCLTKEQIVRYYCERVGELPLGETLGGEE